ncbi:hypothetical protein N801_09800 [Knoellia aerolata DSM 18566]|uniref:Uncharacterized protein n=1 Tax=Knoellia aerolata DSM 18566 TaxID=1385519 RepID=A0A0A0JUL4_9MICO|nr:hypothetical protein N801_09800 [Knoellia aerolata DSM 18566]
MLARPFPPPGRLVEHAYWELSIAANGTPEQIKALGDLRRLPKPWDPPTCTHPDLRLEIWVWLDDVVTWINHEHIWDTDGYIPSCWPEHPHLVHDLAVLADQRRRAGMANTSDALEDWHRYALPAFLDRMRQRLKSHCENGHQSWPSTGRHARHSGDPHRSRRARAFKDDAQVPPGPAQAAHLPPRLSVVDGNLIDNESGELL